MSAALAKPRLRPGAMLPLRPVPMGLLYYTGVRCPACGGRHFTIGRVTADCAGCGTTMILSTLKELEQNHA